jgi:CSLREA domain-containing protein
MAASANVYRAFGPRAVRTSARNSFTEATAMIQRFGSSTCRSGIAVVLAVMLVLLAAPATAATFVVNSTADSGSGGCTAGECTLREAISAANATTALDTINFAFPLDGLDSEVLIQPLTPLPTIIRPLVVNGYSVAGAAVNTDPAVSNAVLRIRLDGALAGAQARGLSVCANSVRIRGLAITRFGRAGVSFGTTDDGSSCATAPANGALLGNFIGVATDGVTAAGNSGFGVFVSGAEVEIGSINAADRNIISAQNGSGVQVQSSAANGTTIIGNLIGTDRSASLLRGNVTAISVGGGVSSLLIGTAGAPNRIAGNTGGIRVGPDAGGVQMFANHFVLNLNFGIDLLTASGSGGVSPNDPGDADSGGNGQQNFLDEGFQVSRTAAGIRIQGVLQRTTAATPIIYTVAAYATSSCHSSGHGQGEFLGSATAATSSGSAPIDVDVQLATQPAAGSFITTTVTSPLGDTSEFSSCAPLDPPPLVVTSTADTDGSICAADCTLRQAINASNINPEPKVISFNIPGSGELVIQPATPLPTITAPVTIDGYSQPGAAVNTDPLVSNAVLRVRLDGVAAGEASGLGVCSSEVVVRGLSITRFNRMGVVIGTDTTGNNCSPSGGDASLLGNFIGVASDGVTTAGNQSFGVFAFRARVDVGSGSVADRNVISSNALGISISLPQGMASRVVNNLIGTDRSALFDRGNLEEGLFLGTNASDVQVGQASAPNWFRFNQVGVAVAGATGLRNRLAANRFSDNDQLGIDLHPSVNVVGVTPNDPGDIDTGGNGLQNFPELELAERSAGGLRLVGRLELPAGTANSAYQIAAYASASCDPSGFGEGERFLGLVTVDLSEAGGGVFDLEFASADPLEPGVQITTTATGPEGTSEFSACITATDPVPGIVVNSAGDQGSGGCTASECTLREAITLANTQPGADLIRFAIPGNGPFFIAPLTVLPAITEALTIDGYTQTGAAPNAAEFGSDAVLMIELRDSDALDFGLMTCASDITIRGLSITGFNVAGIAAGMNATDTCNEQGSNVRILGNFLGLRPNGNVLGNAGGIRVSDTQVQIGGPALADRNLISRNQNFGVQLLGAGSTGSSVQNNLIGTGLTETTNLGNIGAGVLVIGVSDLQIGGALHLENTIAFNGTGVLHTTDGEGNRLFENSFFANGGLAIDLSSFSGPDGVTANDVDDSDSGPNGLQNFPLLSSAVSAGNGVVINGQLDVPGGIGTPVAYTLAFYESAACDASGHGEGEILLDVRQVNLSSSVENFAVTLPSAPASGHVITATATNPAGSTSEFSNCVTAARPVEVFADGFE